MRDNARLENVHPSLELVRISNRALKVLQSFEANSWKNRRKLFKQIQINHVVWWVKTSKILSQTFSKFEIAGIFPNFFYYRYLVVKTQSSIEFQKSILYLFFLLPYPLEKHFKEVYIFSVFYSGSGFSNNLASFEVKFFTAFSERPWGHFECH